MLEIVSTAAFRRDLKRCQKRGLPLDRLQAVVTRLAGGEALEDRFRDHALGGAFNGFRECHIQPDWLLVYQRSETRLLLVLARTGSHADLFDL